MGIVATQQEDTLQLLVGSEMTIYTATELKADLYKEWDKALEIEVNLSQVDELDCAGIQLLLQMKSDGERLQKPVRFVEHSPVVIEALEILNLISRFSDPVVLSADKAEA